MYKLDHPVNLTQLQSIQRRRRLDQERMTRIFDPKVRVKGIDKSGLEEQIRIKQELRQVEKERNDVSARVTMETNELLQMLDAKVAASRRAINQEIVQFREDHQRPWMRRDFDLYDPEGLKKDSPARVSNTDPRNTVSGMQKFEGEDLERKDRIQAQKDQMQVWAWQKICEKEAARQAQVNQDKRHELEVIQNNQRILVCMEAERLQRKQIAMQDSMFNLKLAMEKKLRDAEQKRLEMEKNQEEINRNVTGDFLTERPAASQPGPHSVRIDAFKGATPEQIAEIQRTREHQIAQARESAEKRKNDEQQWDKYQMFVSRAMVLMEREKNRAEREREIQLRNNNRTLAMEFNQRKALLDKVVYTNPPTEAYFAQFNTTSR